MRDPAPMIADALERKNGAGFCRATKAVFATGSSRLPQTLTLMRTRDPLLDLYDRRSSATPSVNRHDSAGLPPRRTPVR